MTALSPAVANAENLTVRYGPKTVLSDLSLAIPEGCVGLLGPNGAGKSTLIKTLMGFLRPASGRATVLEKDTVSEALAIRQEIGLMPEQDCHIPGMNAVTFVAYAGELSGLPSAQALRRAHEVLEYCSLGEARYRNVETYSTGMKQRIKLAQALVHGPKLLFLDEPTNGLDPQGRDGMLALIKDVSRAKGLSVVVSSHLLPDIERTCDHVIVMRGGRAVRQGPIASLRDTGADTWEVELRTFSAAFVESVTRRGGVPGFRQGALLHFDLSKAELPPGLLLFQAARESGAQIRGFRPAQRSLQEVFMEAVEG
ncbi:MAG: ABC transporter ATP-binding protein [Capsulimonadales bacterium]|nr:ABC transporter ATP-binding protein [Capsulimonadales bacterium]